MDIVPRTKTLDVMDIVPDEPAVEKRFPGSAEACPLTSGRSRELYRELWKTRPLFEAGRDKAWTRRGNKPRNKPRNKTGDGELKGELRGRELRRSGRPLRGLLISAGLEESEEGKTSCVSEGLGHLDVRYYCSCGESHLRRDLDTLSSLGGTFIFHLERSSLVGFCEPSLVKRIGRKCGSEPGGTRRLFREAEKPCWGPEDEISQLFRELSRKIEATQTHLGGCRCGKEFRVTVRTRGRSVPLLEFLAERHGLQKAGAWWPRRGGSGCPHHEAETPSSYLTLESRVGLVDGDRAPECDQLERELKRSLGRLDELQTEIEAYKKSFGESWSRYVRNRYGEEPGAEALVVKIG